MIFTRKCKTDGLTLPSSLHTIVTIVEFLHFLMFKAESMELLIFIQFSTVNLPCSSFCSSHFPIFQRAKLFQNRLMISYMKCNMLLQNSAFKKVSELPTSGDIKYGFTFCFFSLITSPNGLCIQRQPPDVACD